MVAQKEMTPAAWASLGALGLLWGGSFLAIRLALDEMGVLTLVAWRVGIAAAILWAVVLARRLPLPRDPRAWGAFAVMGLLNNVAPFLLLSWAQLRVETGLVSILNAATAIFGVLVAAAVFRDERLTRRRAAGVALGFAGVAVAIGVDALRGLDLASLAQVACIGASLSYAFAGAWARARMAGFRPEVAAAGMLAASSAVMVPLALAVDGAPRLDIGPAAWGGVAYVAVASTALAYLLYYRVVARAGAGNALLVTLLVAPVAILLGATVLGETLPAHALGGFGLLVLGLVTLDGRAFRRLRPV